MTAAHPTTRAGTTLSGPGLGWSFTHPLVVDAVALVASVLAAGLAWRPSFDSFRYLVMIGLATAVFGFVLLGFSPLGVDELSVDDLEIRVTLLTGVVLHFLLLLV